MHGRIPNIILVTSTEGKVTLNYFLSSPQKNAYINSCPLNSVGEPSIHAMAFTGTAHVFVNRH